MKSVDFRKVNTNLDYFIRFPSSNLSEPFEWIDKLPYLGSELSSTKLYYSPTNFSSNIKLDLTSSERNSRSSSEIIKEENLILLNFGFEYKVFNNTQFPLINQLIVKSLKIVPKDFEIDKKFNLKNPFYIALP